MKPILIVSLFAISACTTQITCERVWHDPLSGLWGCERPTGSAPGATRGEGTERRSPRDVSPAPEPNPDPDPGPGPDVDPEPEPDPEPGGDTEPDRRTDPEGWQGWRDRKDGREGR